MYRMSWSDLLIQFVIHKGGLTLAAFGTLTLGAQTLVNDLTQSQDLTPITIDFSQFSPAYAALEDEYIQYYEDVKEATQLEAGFVDIKLSQFEDGESADSEEIYQPISHAIENIRTLTNTQLTTKAAGFDGQTMLVQASRGTTQPTQPQAVVLAAPSAKTFSELGWGALVQRVKDTTPAPHNPPIVLGKSTSPQKDHPSQPKQEVQQQTTEALHPLLASRLMDGEKILGGSRPESYQILGDLELKDGLAFIGGMSISHIVGGAEVQSGSINLADATFDINIQQMVGDIVISLVDNNGQLLGEGRLNLNDYPENKPILREKIAIYPVDLDRAGQVISVGSLGRPKPKYISEANIDLYAFNDRTMTNSRGEFRFRDWKNSNSRTLALISKKGFRDSIVMLDSAQDSTVLMFENKYVDSFFEYLRDQGLGSQSTKGTIYGALIGMPDMSGYTVRLEKEKPLYFMEAGFPSDKLYATSSNGQFVFVGLKDGDYVLRIEKDGMTLDERLVVVESGKFSPVYADLNKVKKHLAFYDPFDPLVKIEDIEVRFFDGYQKLTLNNRNTHDLSIAVGDGSAVLDYYESQTQARTFVSRHRNVQKVPLLRDPALMKLITTQGLSLDEGLIIGFISSPENYRARMIEEAPERILYFDEQARIIDPEKAMPFGFIMAGFAPGLKTVVFEGINDQLILASDLIFNDQQAISLLSTEIVPVPIQ